MPFAKGRSGNPGGRPKGYAEMQAAARKHTTKAIKTLVAALGDDKLCVAAAQALLDRGWGKPAQVQTGEGGQGPAKMILEWREAKSSALSTSSDLSSDNSMNGSNGSQSA